MQVYDNMYLHKPQVLQRCSYPEYKGGFYLKYFMEEDNWVEKIVNVLDKTHDIIKFTWLVLRVVLCLLAIGLIFLIGFFLVVSGMVEIRI